MPKKSKTLADNHIEVGRNTEKTLSYYEKLEEYIEESPGGGLLKFRNFQKYTTRQVLSTFLARYELFKLALEVPGNIVECGVLNGGGLMGFAQFSSIFEPVNYLRKVVGFDTFAGHAELTDEDATKTSGAQVKVGGYQADSYDDLLQAIALFDENRSIGHIPKVELVKGRVEDTMPKYLEENPHFLVALLFLDMDLYQPTKFVIETLRNRIPKGGIIVFDELNFDDWPGETLAVMDTLGINNLRLKRFPYEHKISYVVME